MKTNNRVVELEKNFSRMFWVQALMNFKLLNTVISIFYVHRGLSLEQIFLLSVVFAVTNLFAEIPSSYAADRWGRKKTIALAVCFMAVSSVFDFFSHSFTFFVFGLIIYAISYAFLSGTDDALIYDTIKELGREKNSLLELGKYYSAQKFFKIISPLLAVIIARDLLEWQFQVMIAIEFATTIVGLFFVYRLVEPVHHMDLEKSETGIIKDAWGLIRRDQKLIQLILNRTLIFIASFLVWRIHQVYFVSRGASVVMLGIMWAGVYTAVYFGSRNIGQTFSSYSASKKINILNIICTTAIVAFAFASFFETHIILLLGICAVIMFTEPVRNSLFSHELNRKSLSFNRATTLSLSNFLKSTLEVPLILGAAFLVTYNPSYVFLLTAVISVGVVVFIPVRETV